MYNTYKYKYNEITGRLNKEELKKTKRKKQIKWSDTDLANKILAINKLTGEKFFDKECSKGFNNKKFLKSKNRSSYLQEKPKKFKLFIIFSM